MSPLTLAQMTILINAGQVLLWNYRYISTLAELPTQGELDAYNAAHAGGGGGGGGGSDFPATANLSMAGHRLTNIGAPFTSGDAVRIEDLIAYQSNITYKYPCNAATTANITLSGEQTIDGVAVTVPQYVLVKNQTDPVENGMWVCQEGAWIRVSGMGFGIAVPYGSIVPVVLGTANALSLWAVSAPVYGIVGTDGFTFTKVAQGNVSGGMSNPMVAGGDLIFGQSAGNVATAAFGASQTGDIGSIIDGDDATPGGRTGAYMYQHPNVYIDFGSIREIAGIRLCQQASPGTANYTIATSPDNATWTVVYTRTPTVTTETYALTAPVSSRYWRFQAQGPAAGSGDDGWGPRTIEMYPTGVGSPVRLPAGTEGQVLKMVGGVPTWGGGGGGSSDRTIGIVLDGGSSVITTGVKLDVPIDFDGTIVSATILAAQAGSVVIDLWKAAYVDFPPTVANSIVGSAPPTLVSANKSQDLTLAGWTTSVSAGDVLRVNVNSAASVMRLLLSLKVSAT